MKTLIKKLPASSRQDEPPVESADSIGKVITVDGDYVLSAEERAAQIERLEKLAQMSDEDIDFSDIPQRPESEEHDPVYGPWLPREERTVTLRLDAEVVEWLENEGKSQGHLINLLLKREAQRSKRNAAKRASSEMDKAS